MSWPEPTRRSGTPVSANNPFRQSILMRTGSPFDENIYDLYSRSSSSLAEPPRVAASGTSSSGTPPAGPRRASSNPFQSDESEQASTSSVLEPPPPYDDRRRANSETSVLGQDEKARLARYNRDDTPSGSSRPREREHRDRGDRERESHRQSSYGMPRDARESDLDYRERRYREEADKLRADRDRLRAEREFLRSQRESSGRKPSGEHRDREHRDRTDRDAQHSDREKRSERSDRDGHRSDRDREKRREMRRRSKSESARESGRRPSHKDGRPRDKDGRPLDVIDKMDVTGLFGPGSFHHDGPFDACTPHRNKKNAQRAPLEAYAADGPNNSLAVVDPSIGRYKKEQTVFGHNPDTTPFPDAGESFDPTAKAKPIHGSTTMGLGSSTFLDGTPASAAAVAEAGRLRADSGGLSRSRSLLRRQAPSQRPQAPAAGSTPRPTFLEPPRRPELSTRNSSPEQHRLLEEEERPTGLLGRVKSLRIRRER